MAAISMQKQSSRNLVLSPKVQTTYGTALADAALTIRQRFDPSTAFMPTPAFRTDKAMAGKGSEWATDSQITEWDTSATLKTDADSLCMGFMLAMIFGQVTDTGAGPYTHTFTVPAITATMPATTIYTEDTAAVKRHFVDMAASALSITVPERGAIQASLDMVGTGKWNTTAFGSALPALAIAKYLLGSDFLVTIGPTPASVAFTGNITTGSANILLASSIIGLAPGMPIAGAGIPLGATIVSATGTTVVITANATATTVGVNLTASTGTPFSGRQKNLSIKLDRGSAPFKASGDGLSAGSVASGTGKFSVDLTIAALVTDDVNGWFENNTQLAITLQTNPALPYGFGFTFPAAYVKANKLGNIEDKVMWQLTFDETTCVQLGSAAAISAFNIDDQAAWLVAA